VTVSVSEWEKMYEDTRPIGIIIVRMQDLTTVTPIAFMMDFFLIIRAGADPVRDKGKEVVAQFSQYVH
jgi:hypothetical protein